MGSRVVCFSENLAYNNSMVSCVLCLSVIRAEKLGGFERLSLQSGRCFTEWTVLK